MEDKDLSIIIECDSNFCDSWMCFASWYSLQKQLPSADIFISVSNSFLFDWANKARVRFLRKKTKVKNNVIKNIKPSVVAVREFNGNLDVVSSKTNISSVFVDYRYGCGSFELYKWANTKKPPFENALKRFSTYDLTINEYAVLNIWEQACPLYKQLVGGSF
jgi:hypothetical protein